MRAKTTLPILGVGTVKYQIGSNFVNIPDVRYIPGLSESVYSLLIHIKIPGHGLDSSFDRGLHLTFPTFTTQAIVGSDDIYLDMKPCVSSTTSEFKLFSTLPSDIAVCRDITQVDKLSDDNKQLDNILRDLRSYYQDVKLKRQTGLTVPPGFRSHSTYQRQIILHTPPRKSAKENIEPDSQIPLCDSTNLSTPIRSNITSDSQLSLQRDNMSSSDIPFTPIIRSVDKPSTSLPKQVSMTEDHLRACVGYRRIDTLKKNLASLYQPTITLDHTPPDAILDPGFYATLRKKDRSTAPVQRPEKFGDVFHIDIVFGPDISIGNVHYGLICVDRFSRMTYVYPLHNLTGDIQKQLECFFAHLGMVPKRIITDFDLKLIGGSACRYLNSLLVHVNAAPSYRQDKNGLAERHWQTLISMTRNWLASAELPSSFWFYAVRHAAEVVITSLCLWKMVLCPLRLR